MKLSIVFPAFNEKENIAESVSAALAYLGEKPGEVIVVDDGSRDETPSIVNALEKKHPGRVRLVPHPVNLGYAAALRDGFSAARGDWIFYSDADNQFDLREIDLLIPLTEGADLVVGFRKNRQDPPLRIFAAWGYNLVASTLFRLSVRDIDCAFKLFRKDVFHRIRIESKGFLVDLEILAKARKQKMVVREVGVTHLPRTKGQSTVRFRDIFRTLRGIAWLLPRIYLTRT
jgi:glycosyltransferase involved in cell wall biosynthesis